jgi:hypothetical protein
VIQDWNLRQEGAAIPVAEHVPTHLTFMLVDRQLWVAEAAPEVFGPVTPDIEIALNEVRPGLCSEARKRLEAGVALSAPARA